jgi:hypothetical protein
VAECTTHATLFSKDLSETENRFRRSLPTSQETENRFRSVQQRKLKTVSAILCRPRRKMKTVSAKKKEKSTCFLFVLRGQKGREQNQELRMIKRLARRV